MKIIFIKDYTDYDEITDTAVFVKKGETGVFVNMNKTEILLNEQDCLIKNVDQGAFVEAETFSELEQYYARELE